jgi:hypothetical protein
MAIGGIYLVNMWQENVLKTDNQRTAQMTELRESLAKSVTKGVYPIQSQRLTAEFPQNLGDGKLVKAKDTAYYAATSDGSYYLACYQLQRKKVAYFVNPDGAFKADRGACNERIKPELSRFVTINGFTDGAATAWYRGNPTVLPQADIQTKCAGSVHGDSQLAGCYNGTIYVMNYTEPEIASEMYVTAAHEMLHAAYQALSSTERSSVDQLAVAEAKRINDPKLQKYLEGYDQKERPNELHSVLGTEYPNLSPELERHYAQYFKNRSVVVAKHALYQTKIDSLENEITNLKSRLDRIGADAERAKTNGNIALYNTYVAPYNALVEQINAKIDDYNRLTAHTRPASAKQKVGDK